MWGFKSFRLDPRRRVGGLPATWAEDPRVVMFPPQTLPPSPVPDRLPLERWFAKPRLLCFIVCVCSLPETMTRPFNTSKTQNGSKKRLFGIPYLQMRKAKRRKRQSDVFSHMKILRAKALSLSQEDTFQIKCHKFKERGNSASLTLHRK